MKTDDGDVGTSRIKVLRPPVGNAWRPEPWKGHRAAVVHPRLTMVGSRHPVISHRHAVSYYG